MTRIFTVYAPVVVLLEEIDAVLRSKDQDTRLIALGVECVSEKKPASSQRLLHFIRLKTA